MQGKAQLQEVVSSSGGYFQGNETSISFTVGEPVVKTLQSETMMLTQGFQQARLIVTEVNDFGGRTYEIKAYPNPTTDFVHVSTNKELPTTSYYRLSDINGSLIDEKSVDGLTTEVSFQQLIPAVYFISIINHNQVIKIFKIIKR